jgi:hypothetical protein
MRRLELFDVTGAVRDVVAARPVPGAILTISGPDGVSQIRTDSGGVFRVGPLRRGSHSVTVAAVGYVTETFSVIIPHGGAYHGVTVDVVQIRHRALEIYHGVARPLLPRQEVWGRWTPRELAVYSARTFPWLSDEISELTSFFEILYYSSLVNHPTDLDRMESLASNVRASHRDGKKPRSPDG